MSAGWIKLHRQFEKWEWYRESYMVHLWLHLLLNANHEKKKWKGIEIDRGQLITGRKALSIATGISEQKIRTALMRLQQTGEITVKATNKFSIVTLCKYLEYQITEKQNNQQITNKQPTNNHKQEVKEVKNKRLAQTEAQKEQELFDIFWKEYPKKKDKKKARQKWKSGNCWNGKFDKIMEELDYQKNSESWKKEGGQYIPLPSVWIHNERWNDERGAKGNKWR